MCCNLCFTTILINVLLASFKVQLFLSIFFIDRLNKVLSKALGLFRSRNRKAVIHAVVNHDTLDLDGFISTS